MASKQTHCQFTGRKYLCIYIIVNKDGYVLHKVAHKKGKRYDYDIYKKDHPVIPKQVVTVVDLGYLGIEKDHPEQLSSLPKRKKRNQEELSGEEKKSITNFTLRREQ